MAVLYNAPTCTIILVIMLFILFTADIWFRGKGQEFGIRFGHPGEGWRRQSVRFTVTGV